MSDTTLAEANPARDRRPAGEAGDRPASFSPDVDPAAMRTAPSVKWTTFDPEVIPAWVADMDFAPAPSIRAAIHRHVDAHPLVYTPWTGIPGLRESVVERQRARFGWTFEPDDVTLLPGIVPGIYRSVAALASPGEGVVVPTPAYFPFLTAVRRQKRTLQTADLARDADGYRLDVDAIAEAITPATRLLILCNPHNPTGRQFTRTELEAVAELALEHRLWVVSDELHADLTHSGGPHIPLASLGDEIAARTVTLLGPTKAFNLAGLGVGFAITTSEALREQVFGTAFGTLSLPNVVAQVAAKAAYATDDAARWLDGMLDHLRANRRRVAAAAAGWPGVVHHPPEATYLAWLDLRSSPVFDELGDDPAETLRERARVALTPGGPFGPNADGFVRLNFATSGELLDEALGRLGSVLG